MRAKAGRSASFCVCTASRRFTYPCSVWTPDSEREYGMEALRYAGAGDELLDILDGFTDFDASRGISQLVVSTGVPNSWACWSSSLKILTAIVDVPDNPIKFEMRPASPDEAGLFYTLPPEQDEELGGIAPGDRSRTGTPGSPRVPGCSAGSSGTAGLEEQADEMRERIMGGECSTCCEALDVIGLVIPFCYNSVGLSRDVQCGAGFLPRPGDAHVLPAEGLHEGFRVLADFNGIVLAGQELEDDWGYKFATWRPFHGRSGTAPQADRP